MLPLTALFSYDSVPRVHWVLLIPVSLNESPLRAMKEKWIPIVVAAAGIREPGHLPLAGRWRLFWTLCSEGAASQIFE